MTTVFLAYHGSAHHTLVKHAGDGPVSLLVAYPELEGFLKRRHEYNISKWVMDSGAFTVFNTGGTIDVKDYAQACLDMRGDAAEIFGLDVIGDHVGTRKNNEYLWSLGIEAIPAFHMGEPWAALDAMLDRSKIALGGIARKGAGRDRWIKQCFTRIWPKRVHGFGLTSKQFLGLVPFHSVDSASWTFGPAFGVWSGFTGNYAKFSIRGYKDFWVEVEEYRKREAWAKWRWSEEMDLLGSLP